MESISWHLLEPVTTSLISSALGSNTTRKVASLCSDGSAALIYIPENNSTTIDMSAFTGPNVLVDWLDPITQAVTSDSTYSASGTQVITHPGNNSESDTDWIMRLRSV